MVFSFAAGLPMTNEMMAKLIRLGYAAVCSGCGCAVQPGTRGWWDSEERTAECSDCHLRNAGTLVQATPSGATEAMVHVPGAQDGGAGASVRHVHEQNHRRRDERIEQKWGPAAGVVKFLSTEPKSTKAWAKGSEGERRLATLLAKAVGDKAALLHDRRIPGSQANIDHIAIAQSGIWIIDAKNYQGKVEQRDVGGLFRSDQRLYVDNRDRTNLVAGLARQIDAVLGALGDPDVSVDAALCFVDAEWGFFSKPFRQGGVWIGWPKRLAELIAAPGPVTRADAVRMAERLTGKLPPAARTA